jgi:predicted amidohydrolase YtcJ
VGYKWDYPACPDPRKELLDQAFPDNPVVLTQYSGHAHWLNSAALRLLGIDRRRGPDLGRSRTGRPGLRNPGAQILRDPDGEPVGVVRDLGDTALSRRRYRDAYFRASRRERRLDLALETFASLGITSVQDNVWYYPELFSLRSRHRRGALTARFSCWTLGRNPSSPA